MRIPADTAPLHRAGSGHRIGELRFETQVEGAADNMLAVLGDAKGRAGEHRIGLGRAIARKDRRLGLADRIEDIGHEINDPDIDLGLFAGMVVAQEHAQLVDDPRNRALVVAVRTVECLAGMRIDEAQAAKRHWRTGNRVRYRRQRRGKAGYQG